MGSLLARSLAVEDERMSETAIKVIIQEDMKSKGILKSSKSMALV